MRFRAPEGSDSVANTSVQEDQHLFEEEIKQILKISDIREKLLLDGCDTNAPDYKLKVLMKFIQMCREEIFPRHNKAMETIQSKRDEVWCRAEAQLREVASLAEARTRLAANAHRLEAALQTARKQNAAITLRLKETLCKLQDCCNHKTMAEKKLASDLFNMKRKTDDLRVAVTEASAKMNYYDTQVKAQTEMVRKNTKPLYLDNNRAIFMRKNLNSMRQNIEDLVRHVKTLKSQTTDLVGNEISI